MRSGPIHLSLHAWTYNTDGMARFPPEVTWIARHVLNVRSRTCRRCRSRNLIEGWILGRSIPISRGCRSAWSRPSRRSPRRYNQQDYVTIFSEEHVWDTNWKCLTEPRFHAPGKLSSSGGAPCHCRCAHAAAEEVEFDDRGAFRSLQPISCSPSRTGRPPSSGRAHEANPSLEGRWRHHLKKRSCRHGSFPEPRQYVLAARSSLKHLALQPDGPSRTAEQVWRRRLRRPVLAAARLTADLYRRQQQAFLDKAAG